MSNNSSSSLSWFNGGSYNRDLVATPPEDTPPFFIFHQRGHLYYPPQISVSPSRPVTPRSIAPALDDSMQDGQRPWWLSPPQMPVSPSPQRRPFRYSDMTQDGGFFTEHQSH
ncbi:hypothetical protein ACI65C_006433, partial [Semiaphis heraclei]